ncbi:MAG: hypothetical protein ACPG8W_11085 [Candidatus Promineifilaceae bacterium]
MKMTFPSVPVQPLTPALRSLANAQARVSSAENQLARLANQHQSVQTYIATEQQLQAAKLDAERARDTVSNVALSQYDGRCTRLHDDVQIAKRADINLLDQTVALLWLFCDQPEVINFDRPEQLRATLRREGLQNKLCLNRTRILATIEALFERPAVKVCGWITVEDAAEDVWRHVIVSDETSKLAARRVAEARISAEFGRRAWCWAQEPLITTMNIRCDYRPVSEPITLPFARIRQNLAHLVTKHSQPRHNSRCLHSKEDAS